LAFYDVIMTLKIARPANRVNFVTC